MESFINLAGKSQKQWECGQKGGEIQVAEVRLQQLKRRGEHEEMNLHRKGGRETFKMN